MKTFCLTWYSGGQDLDRPTWENLQQIISASVIGFSCMDFFLKKLLWGPRRSKSRDFLVSWSMTHYILRLVFFGTNRPPLYV